MALDMKAATEQMLPRMLHLDETDGPNGLAQLVLTLVKLLHELLEKQAIRRMESGALGDEQLERLGLALMRQAQEIERMCEAFGLTQEDLKLDLGGIEYIDGGS